jgi:transcription initiation factor TFIIIB Brf1 subunit/transcription initiation factor TFIIB
MNAMVDKYHLLSDRFKAMYLKGATYEEMSKELDVYHMTLRDWRKRMSLPPRRDRTKRSWMDVPTGTGLSPRQILASVASQIGITKNDIAFILTRVDKLKSKGLVRGRHYEHVILAAAFLYLRWEGSGRRPLSAEQFTGACEQFGLTKAALFTTSRPFLDAGLYPRKPLLTATLLDRIWKSLQDKYALPDTVKARILELTKEPKIKYRTPSAILAGCSYIACIEAGNRITQEELAGFFGVTEVSLRNIINVLRETCQEVRDVIGEGVNYRRW